MATETATKNIGKVVQVIGPVLDIEFESENLPELYNAIEINSKVDGTEINVTSEVQQHIGRNQVRAVAMSSTQRTYTRLPTWPSSSMSASATGIGIVNRCMRAQCTLSRW